MEACLDIRSHPWYSKPLMPEHEAAWNQLQAAQKELESKIKRTEQNVKHAYCMVECFVFRVA